MINSHGDIFMEKHWKTAVKKAVCDYFFEAQEKASSPNDIPPVIATPYHYIIRLFSMYIQLLCLHILTNQHNYDISYFYINVYIVCIPVHQIFFFSIYRDRLYFVAVVTKEVQPLFAIEFLHRIVDTFIVSI